jgi:hypothetical protein
MMFLDSRCNTCHVMYYFVSLLEFTEIEIGGGGVDEL